MALCRGFLSVVLVVLAASCLVVPSLAAVYTVGGSNGWTMGVDYSTWSTAGRTFSVGDTLVFNYAGGHTVDEVTESDYKTCTVGNSITTDSSGTTAITLTAPGSHYFICGIAGHCSIGMKLAVNVAGAGAGGVISSSQPPLMLPSSALPPAFDLAGLMPPQPPLGSGMALPPSFGFRSVTPSIAGSSRNVNSESLAPMASSSSSSTSLPDFSAANAAAMSSVFLAVFVTWGSMFVFGLF
ncbi:unnamed protein product [Rhodiola kirilowii]